MNMIQRLVYFRNDELVSALATLTSIVEAGIVGDDDGNKKKNDEKHRRSGKEWGLKWRKIVSDGSERMKWKGVGRLVAPIMIINHSVLPAPIRH